jgi:hypothetical protein
MNSLSWFASPRLLSWNELPQNALAIRDPLCRTKEIFHRKSGEDFYKENFSFTALAATLQVSPLCQLAIRWWQLELPLQQDSSSQSPQAAGLWELDLSQE